VTAWTIRAPHSAFEADRSAVQDLSPETPEARRQQQLAGDTHVAEHKLDRLSWWARPLEVGKRVVVGVFKDGFIHAGNLAYLTLLTLFPFFILTAALASLFGRDADTLQAVETFLSTMPGPVQTLLRQPIEDVLTERTGWLLWIGGAVGLWTVGSFIETIRDILRRAYGTKFTNPFWQYRLTSMGIIIAAVILMMTAFAAQIFLAAAEQFVFRLIPVAGDLVGLIQLSRLVPLFVIWGALYALMWSLTPSRYRYGAYPKWPGALFVALWWFGALALLPLILAQLTSYDLTYGSLAGVIIALLFFWVVGLGLVIGAHLNAALAETPAMRLEDRQVGISEAQ
jgi:membrane protein